MDVQHHIWEKGPIEGTGKEGNVAWLATIKNLGLHCKNTAIVFQESPVLY